MNFTSFVKEKNLKITSQRLCILRVLHGNTHPAIDELYKEVQKSFPSISLATVYKNINTLKQSGLVIEINTLNGKTRYDIYSKPHIHIFCKKCGHLEDADYTDSVYQYQKELELANNYTIEKLDIVATIDNCKACEQLCS